MKQIRITVTDGIAANAHYLANATGISYEQVYNCLLHIACENKDLSQLALACKQKSNQLWKIMAMEQQATKMKGA